MTLEEIHPKGQLVESLEYCKGKIVIIKNLSYYINILT